MLNRKER